MSRASVASRSRFLRARLPHGYVALASLATIGARCANGLPSASVASVPLPTPAPTPAAELPAATFPRAMLRAAVPIRRSARSTSPSPPQSTSPAAVAPFRAVPIRLALRPADLPVLLPRSAVQFAPPILPGPPPVHPALPERNRAIPPVRRRAVHFLLRLPHESPPPSHAGSSPSLRVARRLQLPGAIAKARFGKSSTPIRAALVRSASPGACASR